MDLFTAKIMCILIFLHVYSIYTLYYIETCMEKVFHAPIGEILCIPLFSPLKYKAWLINEENPFITFFF